MHVVFKGGEESVVYGKLFLHEDKEDENFQLEGQGVGGDNPITTTVRVMSLKLYAFTPHTTMLIVTCGLIPDWRRSRQEIALQNPLIPVLILLLPIYFIINLLIVGVIFKGGEVQVDHGQPFLHEDKEDEEFHLKVQGGGGDNPMKTKVCVMFLKSFTPPCPK